MKRLWGIRHARYAYLAWRRAWCWRHIRPWSWLDLDDDGPSDAELADVWKGKA